MFKPWKFLERVAGKKADPRHQLQRLMMNFEKTGIYPYNTSINPFQIVYLSPRDINKFSYRVRPGDTRRIEASIGDVRAGDWDTVQRSVSPHLPDRLTDVLFADRFENTDLYQSFADRYKNNIPWKETEYYAAMVDSVSDFSWHGCTSQEDVDNRMAELDDLFTDIQKNGYRAHTEITKCDCKRCLSGEIAVDIGRNGSPLFVAGRHRLSIAKILELDDIPTVVVVRHHDFITS